MTRWSSKDLAGRAPIHFGALIENGRGYDPKDERMANNSNQMNIQSMYSDIDLDANEIETEFQASFEELLWFVNINLANTNQGDYESEEVNVIFSLIF
ncbi:phage portal protein [Psychrobacillus psychrodurans]|uniref:phage portal protein n=1 Tax=Psychrobacillus psychrodurans TaxID=126157 RepID=UPI001F4D51C0|nr:phage portal protein [Psychrobacillus psychrodurans]MCK1996941.1 phage portal protein [Psychrobacillus psychrodurans]